MAHVLLRSHPLKGLPGRWAPGRFTNMKECLSNSGGERGSLGYLPRACG